MNDTGDQLVVRGPSCATQFLRYVVLPVAVFALLANTRDIYRYLRLVAMSTGSGQHRQG